MKKNISGLDKIIRIVIALVLGVLFLNGVVTGTVGIVLLAVAGILVLTVLFNFCPIYRLFGWSTCKIP